jgi:hypothetical protein
MCMYSPICLTDFDVLEIISLPRNDGTASWLRVLPGFFPNQLLQANLK